jgi:copper transport protein
VKHAFVRLAVLTALLIAGWFTIFAGPAQAHAQMLSSDPPSGQTLTDPPEQIIVRFSEAVTATKEAFHLYDGAGNELKVGDIFHPEGDPNSLAVKPAERSTLSNGSFIAMYRIVSADSHAIHGAINFQVGTASATADTTMVQTLLAGDRADGSISALHGILRGVTLLATAMSIGAIAMLMMLEDTRVPRAFARWSLSALLAATILGVFSQGAYTNTLPLGRFFDLDTVRSTLDTDFGAGALLRFGATTLALVTLSTRRFSILLGVYAFIIAASFGVAGHASTGRLPVAGVLLDLAHIVAGSAWLGGMVVVLAVVLGKNDYKQRAVEALSRVALPCAAVVLTTGLLQAWRQLETFAALTGTDHGRLIIAKTVLFVALISVGSFSRRAVQQASSSIRRHMTVELVFALAVIIVTTVLTGTSPSSPSQPTVYERSSTVGELRVTLRVEPTRVGSQTVMLSIDDLQGRAADVPEVAMTLTLANEGVGPFSVDLDKRGPGRFASSSATIPQSGTWTARVVIRTTDIDQSSTSFAVPISNAPTISNKENT